MNGSRAMTLIGMLVALAILLVLGVVLTSALNKAMTGGGSTLPGTAASHQDRTYLVSIFQSMAVGAQLGEGRFLVPSALTRRRDVADDTTAGLFSAMIAQQYAVPEQLYSANERNPNVWLDEDYDYLAYNPAEDTYWDPAFVADLELESNTSFAHVPLHGRRLRQLWRFGVGSATPLMGNRGPADGVADPNSYTYDAAGRWAGHVVFGDGHVEYVESFTLSSVFFDAGGQRQPDNLFRMDDGPDGADVILTFTKAMTEDGPVIQHD
jgi:prepilin-type processing-associated H-X9-DG protein